MIWKLYIKKKIQTMHISYSNKTVVATVRKKYKLTRDTAFIHYYGRADAYMD